MARFYPRFERCGGDRGRSLAPTVSCLCGGGLILPLWGGGWRMGFFFLGRALRYSPLEAPLERVSSWADSRG